MTGPDFNAMAAVTDHRDADLLANLIPADRTVRPA